MSNLPLAACHSMSELAAFGFTTVSVVFVVIARGALQVSDIFLMLLFTVCLQHPVPSAHVHSHTHRGWDLRGQMGFQVYLGVGFQVYLVVGFQVYLVVGSASGVRHPPTGVRAQVQAARPCHSIRP